ncbi:MAG: helix-turn-helix domain-containing protein [Clostridiales bacterium]|nr:helix-turn-helix domain-containing protein [Clostridiales bacterium]
MDIGTKIRDARLSVGLSQEAAAEALGVSRQTISNWETGKTYPDIVSVVKMSDLYAISLDRLLKDDRQSNDYVDYLAKSTNTVKSKNRLAMLILTLAYFVIWAVAVIAFWCFAGPTDAMGYSLVFLWLVLPITTLVISVFIGKFYFWGKWQWLSVIVFGIMYMLAEYATFGVSGMIASERIDLPQIVMLLVGAAISAVGLAVGFGIHYLEDKRKETKAAK